MLVHKAEGREPDIKGESLIDTWPQSHHVLSRHLFRDSVMHGGQHSHGGRFTGLGDNRDMHDFTQIKTNNGQEME